MSFTATQLIAAVRELAKAHPDRVANSTYLNRSCHSGCAGEGRYADGYSGEGECIIGCALLAVGVRAHVLRWAGGAAGTVVPKFVTGPITAQQMVWLGWVQRCQDGSGGIDRTWKVAVASADQHYPLGEPETTEAVPESVKGLPISAAFLDEAMFAWASGSVQQSKLNSSPELIPA